MSYCRQRNSAPKDKIAARGWGNREAGVKRNVQIGTKDQVMKTQENGAEKEGIIRGSEKRKVTLLFVST